MFLGDETQMKENWDNVLEKVKGWLLKWLLPKMSYRGRTLITNNLVSSTVWHLLACVDPPSLLAEAQRVLIDFFWGRMHWIPQSVPFLPKEEGVRAWSISPAGALPSASSCSRGCWLGQGILYGDLYHSTSCNIFTAWVWVLACIKWMITR